MLFAGFPLPFTFFSEQFWGRAARASVIRKDPGARYFWWSIFSDSSMQTKKAARCASPLASISSLRVSYCVLIVKFTVMGTCVSTAWPSRMYGLKRHCFTASRAASARIVGPAVTSSP